MKTVTVLLAGAVVCGIWASVIAVLITRWLDQRGLQTPFPLIRLFLFRNIGRYREMSQNETGRVGPLFYWYIVSINAALVLALVALFVYTSGI